MLRPPNSPQQPRGPPPQGLPPRFRPPPRAPPGRPFIRPPPSMRPPNTQMMMAGRGMQPMTNRPQGAPQMMRPPGMRPPGMRPPMMQPPGMRPPMRPQMRPPPRPSMRPPPMRPPMNRPQMNPQKQGAPAKTAPIFSEADEQSTTSAADKENVEIPNKSIAVIKSIKLKKLSDKQENISFNLELSGDEVAGSIPSQDETHELDSKVFGFLLAEDSSKIVNLSINPSSNAKLSATFELKLEKSGKAIETNVLDSSKKAVSSLIIHYVFEQCSEENRKVWQYIIKKHEKGTQHSFEGHDFSDQDILEAFISFDLDKNNHVGASELKHLLNNIGETVLDEDIDAMIALYDHDGDGQVSFKEFYSMVTSGKAVPNQLLQAQTQNSGSLRNIASILPPEKSIAKPSNPKESRQQRGVRKEMLQSFIKSNSITPKSLKKSYKRYKAFSTGLKEGDKFISIEEFGKLLDIPSSTQMEKVYQTFRSKQGLDFKETLISLFLLSGAEKEEQIKFSFLLFDEDGNNVISKSELCQILKANHMASSTEEISRKAETIMAQADDNNDGVLNFEEFVTVSRKFPNILWGRF